MLNISQYRKQKVNQFITILFLSYYSQSSSKTQVKLLDYLIYFEILLHNYIPNHWLENFFIKEFRTQMNNSKQKIPYK